MAVDLAPHNPYGLTLRTPVLAAAGSLGYGVEYARYLDLRQRQAQVRREPRDGTPEAQLPGEQALDGQLQTLPLPGAVVTRSTTLRPRRARPLPRIIETAAGLLYSGIDHNPGLRYVITRCAPVWAGWDVPVIVSIAGEQTREYAEAALQLEGVEGVAGIEVNLAASDSKLPTRVAKVVAEVRAATLLPLLVKLPPDAPDVVALALATADAGADAITLGGGMPALVVDPVSGEQVKGWLCGPALRPLALALVAAVAPAVPVPVIGIGGITTAADARQFLAVGAKAVGLGAALLTDPYAAGRVAAELYQGEA